MNNNDIYGWVTDQILAALERGVVPWRRPWRNVTGADSLHRNLVSGKSYRGVNQFLCEISAASGGYSSPYWLSFKQVKDKGGKVRKGEKGTLVVFWKILRKKSDKINAKTGEPVVETIPLLRYYKVWNVDQCDDLKVPEPAELPDFDPIENAQGVLDNMPQRPETFHRGNRAFYSPLADMVTLPLPEAFDAPEGYYNTAYHEYAHSTGHESRLGRVKEWTSFGSDPYATEELVAELTAAMLCGTVGISVTHEQSASYIANWSARFQQDKKLIVSAAGKAQKAADFVLGRNGNGDAEAEAVAEKELAHA